jgi:hypothetical protein
LSRSTLTRRTPQRVLPLGSPAATRLAVGIMEVLNGVCGPGEGSRLLGLSLTRHHTLEARAVQGLVHALEPRPHGRHGDGLDAVRREKQELERTVQRLQALLRATQRAVRSRRRDRPRGPDDGDRTRGDARRPPARHDRRHEGLAWKERCDAGRRPNASRVIAGLDAPHSTRERLRVLLETRAASFRWPPVRGSASAARASWHYAGRRPAPRWRRWLRVLPDAPGSEAGACAGDRPVAGPPLTAGAAAAGRSGPDGARTHRTAPTAVRAGKKSRTPIVGRSVLNLMTSCRVHNGVPAASRRSARRFFRCCYIGYWHLWRSTAGAVRIRAQIEAAPVIPAIPQTANNGTKRNAGPSWADSHSKRSGER